MEVFCNKFCYSGGGQRLDLITNTLKSIESVVCCRIDDNFSDDVGRTEFPISQSGSLCLRALRAKTD